MSDLPTTANAWIITANQGGLDALTTATRPVPKIEAHEVLVKMRAVSLNYRDIAIPQGIYPVSLNFPFVAASDGAGEVLAVGSAVTEFKVGDAVATIFAQSHQSGRQDRNTRNTVLGGPLDGVLREYAVFPATGLVRAPKHLTHEETATLPCAAVTAWNALYGGQSPIRAGECVLVQGTGGVSVFALQFAKATGAFVIATTSSDEKAERLKAMGADVVINYKTTPNWGEVAREKSPNGDGADIVVDVAGEATLAQSYEAVKTEGTIALIGFLGKSEKPISSLEPLIRVCSLRGIAVGSREQMKAMNRCMEINNIKPVVDEKIFNFKQTKDAYKHLLSQQHFGKIVIRID